MLQKELIRKYNVPGPRYTSYPTVPYWDKAPLTEQDWQQHVKQTFQTSNHSDGISLYIHLPYCESLCTFCACNKRITKNHEVETPYIDTLLKEWQLYLNLFGDEKPRIREIHLGGGTPTFFSPESLTRLLKGILDTCEIPADAEFGFEGHPKNTSKAHLQALYDVGFRRVSYGIQDFDPKVQDIINRVQPFDMVKEATDNAREVGYTSVNFDLIYGLPFQHKSSIVDTIEKVNTLRPDRIAYYSYAHVPWVGSTGQRRFTEADLPADEEKRELYEVGKEMLLDAGYIEIGMDHFALKSEALAVAAEAKSLHRNFMGYTPNYTKLMVGLGCSSISDSWTAFAQNLKKVEEYREAVEAGQFPIFKGHQLTEEDLIIRKHILNVMCHFETSWEDASLQTPIMEEAVERLEEMISDGLVQVAGKTLKVTPKGYPFVRNICMAFDARLLRDKPTSRLFSQTV
ncbi:oxygen-independent coproporphyrinogen III oxidase [Limibacter armeniacum]|uniref:oxygen-independent coproporphyrinogen III oxidase n=1 Tax=Limibacter armeniacum TaxID=466084 RepID=UPI002FE66746